MECLLEASLPVQMLRPSLVESPRPSSESPSPSRNWHTNDTWNLYEVTQPVCGAIGPHTQAVRLQAPSIKTAGIYFLQKNKNIRALNFFPSDKASWLQGRNMMACSVKTMDLGINWSGTQFLNLPPLWSWVDKLCGTQFPCPQIWMIITYLAGLW